MMDERFELNEEMMEEVNGGNAIEDFVDNFEKGWDKLWGDIFKTGEDD